MLLSKREPIHLEDAIGRASTAFCFALHDVTQDARRSITANNIARPVGIEPATTVARTLDPVLGWTDHTPPSPRGGTSLKASLFRALPLDRLRARKRKVEEALHRA